MKEPIILFVDDLPPEELRAFVESHDSIYYNLNLFRPDLATDLGELLADNNEGTYTFQAGRYTCVLTASLDNNTLQLMLADLQKREDWAIALSKKFPQPDIILHAFRDSLLNYDRDYDLVKLVKGNPPQ